MKHAVALLVALSGVLAYCQQPPRPPQGGPRAGGPRVGFFLLMSPDVQKELGLTPSQKQSLEKAMQRSMRQPGEGRPPEQGQGGQPPRIEPNAMEQRFREMEKAVDGILKPAQKSRLAEISLQMQGPSALLRDDIAKKVGLTSAQQANLRKVFEKNRPSFPRMSPDADPKAWEKARVEADKKRKALDSALLGTLDAGQRAKWAKLVGKPFKRSPRGTGFGGPRPGPGGAPRSGG